MAMHDWLALKLLRLWCGLADTACHSVDEKSYFIGQLICVVLSVGL